MNQMGKSKAEGAGNDIITVFLSDFCFIDSESCVSGALLFQNANLTVIFVCRPQFPLPFFPFCPLPRSHFYPLSFFLLFFIFAVPHPLPPSPFFFSLFCPLPSFSVLLHHFFFLFFAPSVPEQHRRCEEVGRDDSEGGRRLGRTAGPSGA